MYVGIDVSKDRLDIATLGEGAIAPFHVSRDEKDLSELAKTLKPLKIELIVVEVK